MCGTVNRSGRRDAAARSCEVRREGRGFTLLELLVVISIIAILVTMLAPSLHVVRTEAALTACAINQRNLYNGVLQYLDASDDRLPPVGRSASAGTHTSLTNLAWKNYNGDWELLWGGWLGYGGFIEDKENFICPDSSVPNNSVDAAFMKNVTNNSVQLWARPNADPSLFYGRSIPSNYLMHLGYNKDSYFGTSTWDMTYGDNQHIMLAESVATFPMVAPNFQRLTQHGGGPYPGDLNTTIRSGMNMNFLFTDGSRGSARDWTNKSVWGRWADATKYAGDDYAPTNCRWEFRFWQTFEWTFCGETTYLEWVNKNDI